MNKIAVMLAAVAAILLPQLYTVAAHASSDTTFVSITGSDSNTSSDCFYSAPCQSFDAALTVTKTGGQIVCLDTGFFFSNPLTITQSITIDCHERFVNPVPVILTCAGDGIHINAPSGVVTLRNINIAGLPSISCGQNGIVVEAASVVNIEDCVIENFTQSGINDQRAGGGQLFIKNTVLRNNGSSSTSLRGGIHIVPGSGVTAEVSIDRSQINGNYFGIVADGRSGGIIKGAISDSVVSGSTENGITAISSGSSVVFITDQTKVTNNSAAGLFAGGSNAGMLARNTTVYGNAIGLDATGGGTLYTYGNNSVNGNTTNGAFTGTVALQ